MATQTNISLGIGRFPAVRMQAWPTLYPLTCLLRCWK